jgi:hypothetical protein
MSGTLRRRAPRSVSREMGEVYGARDTRLKRDVAIKLCTAMQLGWLMSMRVEAEQKATPRRSAATPVSRLGPAASCAAHWLQSCFAACLDAQEMQPRAYIPAPTAAEEQGR